MPDVRAATRRSWRVFVPMALAVALVSALVTSLPAQAAVPSPSTDPSYRYTAGKSLASIKAGTVLKTRTISYHIVGLALPLKATQLLYRSTNQIGNPRSTSRP